MDDTTLGKLLTEAHREHADYRNPEGVSVSQSSSSVVFDRTGKPVGERNVDQSIGFGVTRNTYCAHSKFSENTQTEKVVDRTGKPVGENSSNAQIRTLLDEQRQMIIAEYCEKIGHHELQAARAEEERRILQEELWRQQLEFREVHQQSLTEMEELRKFQSSTFDTTARRKLIEDQNTIMELSGRVQELQNEVNCMNDSKAFQDAESVRSGKSHVTSHQLHSDVSHQESLEEECHLLYCCGDIGSARSSPGSRWRRFMIVTAARKSDRSRIGAFLPDLFDVRYHCLWYLWNSSLARRYV